MRRLVPVLLALLVVASGCASIADDALNPSGSTDAPDSTDDPAATPTPSVGTSETSATPATTAPPAEDAAGDDPPADPDEDVIGWENGYWHNETLAVDAGDGLNDSEFRAAKARAMARVETVRGLEFHSDVEFEFLTREAYEFPVGEEDDFRDAYWEAAFVVGEDRRAVDAYRELYDVVVDGVAYGGDRIVMIVENPDSPRLDTAVLAHELVHAVESQNDVYGGPARPTSDAVQALSSTIEGSAMYYEQVYTDQCETRWNCIDAGTATPPTDADRVNEGLYVDFALRYTMGQQFVEVLAERDGDALERMRGSPPASTEQVVHPAQYPDDEPERVRIDDRSDGTWDRVRRSDGQGGDTIGAARLYTMLWYNGVVDTDQSVEVTVGQQVPLNYSHPATDGWAGDRVVVYANDSARGYVFESTWDSPRDARQFQAAYLEMLRSHGAREVDDGVYVVEEGPFADAFRVSRDGDTLVVVNAPTVAALDDVHAVEE